MSNPLIIDAVPDTSYADISREFDAPVEALFRAHADPELFAQWIGPVDLTTEVTHWEFRTGGGYRFLQRHDSGEYAFRGVFHTVRENELIIQTFEFEGWPDEISVDKLLFESLPGGRSRLVGHSVFSTVEALENMQASGMEKGMREGYDKLEALIAREG